MRGAIHGIWLVTPGGKLHPAILPKFESWAPIAEKQGFQIILWTNTDQLAPEELQRLNNANFIIKDPNACRNSPLFKYYKYFYAKGLDGDITSFAFASDILRMAILDFTAENKYFIYVDANDVALPNLEQNLQQLDQNMQNSTIGFSFPIISFPNRLDWYDVRNDVLLAYKQKNPKFFQDYLTVYWANLERTYQRYKKPATVSDAQILENSITNSVTPMYFSLYKNEHDDLTVGTHFSSYVSTAASVNSLNILKHERLVEHGNTWLPEFPNIDANVEVAINTTYIDNLANEREELAAHLAKGMPTTFHKTVSADSNTSISVSSIVIVITVLLITTVGIKLYRRHFARKS